MGVGNIASSGISAALKNMESISNNIANVNTLGYKKTFVNFADLYVANTGRNAIGIGTHIASVRQDFSAGRIESSQSGLDLRIANDAFFIQKNPISGQVSYTRAGRFEVDRDGNLVGFNGVLQGYPAVNGKVLNSGNLIDLKVPILPIPAQPTDNVRFQLNLDSQSTVLSTVFDKTNPDTYNFRSDETLYDSLGNPYSMSAYYVKTAGNTWDVHVLVNDTEITQGGMTFNTDGSLASVSGLSNLAWTPGDGAAAQTFSVAMSGSTQFASSNKVYDHQHTGMASGTFNGLSIDRDGQVLASYSNGLNRIEGQIALARFKAPQGLLQFDNMSWLESTSSGAPMISADTSQNAINGNALEYSNVDLSEELVKLIAAQHDFQANAQVQQTYNQVLQTIENL